MSRKYKYVPSCGGIYAGEGIYAGGPLRTCLKYKDVPSVYGHDVKRCADWDFHYTRKQKKSRGRSGFNLPLRRPRNPTFNLPLDDMGYNLPLEMGAIPQLTSSLKRLGTGYTDRGTIANKMAAERSPWLSFLRQWRAQTGSNDLRLASQEYHKLYGK